jgi:hypothetical protein
MQKLQKHSNWHTILELALLKNTITKSTVPYLGCYLPNWLPTHLFDILKLNSFYTYEPDLCWYILNIINPKFPDPFVEYALNYLPDLWAWIYVPTKDPWAC